MYDEDIWGDNLPHYYVIPERAEHIDIGEYITYAIKVEQGGFVQTIHDVSTCREAVFSLAEKMNRLKLSSLHFLDVVTDFIK